MITTDETEEAFTALSDATRIGILRTLWDAEDHEATFTELREAVGMRDSGQFNYHLDKLTGRFVTTTPWRRLYSRNLHTKQRGFDARRCITGSISSCGTRGRRRRRGRGR